MLTPPLNDFDRSKPFYPLVMDFIAGYYGWLAIWSRGIGRAAADAAEREGTEVPEDSHGVPLRALAASSQLPSVIKPLGLASRAQGSPIEIDHDALAAESVNESRYLMTQLPRRAENLLLLAWETTHGCRTQVTTREPLWQFLRHCRHAGGHGGRFNFLHGEPRRPAEWKTLEMTAGLQGSRLFDGPATPTSTPDDLEEGLLAPGDAVALLWDIEQAYPELTIA
jgi:hypothetical protein